MNRDIDMADDFFPSSRGIRDYWQDGMSRPHPTLGWFPLSVKGGIIRYWTLTSVQEYFRYLDNGYHSNTDFGQFIRELPCRMHLCLVCNCIFDAGFQNTVAHCDSQTHRNRLTDVLDLDAPLATGLSRAPSVEDLCDSFATVGLSAASAPAGFEIPPTRQEASSRQTSPASANSDVDLSSQFSSSMRIANASETAYTNLLDAMSCMGL